MSKDALEAARAAREAMELLKRGDDLTEEERQHLKELYSQWQGARDKDWQEAEHRIEDTLWGRG
ncbi:MAG: hypothetical protein SV910_00090 [Chloroflexota bacterium]|nr:hypothetical protein [Chloroflexota bacterium]